MICSEGVFFDRRCNELEQWLKARGYRDGLVREQILRARKFKRDDLLDRKPREETGNKLVFNITYHPAFARIKDTLSKIHLLLTPNEEHCNVFPAVPIIGFRRGKSLQDMLVHAKLPEINIQYGSSGRCDGKRCGICNFIQETSTFSDKDLQSKYTIKGGCLNCNSRNVVYLIQCRTCNMQYVGSSTTKFRFRFNNYRCCHRKYSSNQSVAQASFQAHFNQPDHNGMDDWSFILIDSASGEDSVRRKESFWQFKLNTFFPTGLNEREVSLDCG